MWLLSLTVRLSALIIIASIVSSLPSRAADQEVDKALVALFGDSISVGFQFVANPRLSGGGNSGVGCPDIYLQALLVNQGVPAPNPSCQTFVASSPIRDSHAATREVRDAVVVSWGVTGSNTAQGLSRLASDLNSSSAQFPDRTKRFSLINYGTNDIGSGISLAGTRFNLEQMVSRTRSQTGFEPVISTILPRSGGGTVIDSRVAPINAQIRSIAAADPNLELVDLFQGFVDFPGGWPQLILVETSNANNILRIHPTDRGYLFMIELWFDQFLRDNITPFPLAAEVNIAPIIDLLLNDSQ